MSKRLPSLITLFFALVGLVFIPACDSKSEQTTSEQEAESEHQEETKEKIKLTFAFQPQENPEGLSLNAEQFAEFIAEKTGYEAEVFIPTSYAAVVEALRSENADVAYFSGLPYLRAHELAGAELLVVEERRGNPYYYSQWYARKDSDIEGLGDLKGRAIAFTSPTATSGYLFPMAQVIDDGFAEKKSDPMDYFGNVIFAGGYEQALLALVNGQVEAAAASDYSFQLYLSEEQQEQLKVIKRQGPVPTHGLAIRSALPQEVKDAVRQALLALNEEENQELLKSVYGAEKLVEREHDEHVGALSRALELVDMDVRL